MRVTKLPPDEREVPGEPGNFFSFRRLSGDEIDEAQAGSVKEMLARYGPDAIEALTKMTGGRDAAAAADREPDPLAGYSEALLVEYGLVAWCGPNYTPEELNSDTKRELDKGTRAWAAGVVLEISELTKGEEGRSGTPSNQGQEPSLRSA